jgi:hypothetical protein
MNFGLSRPGFRCGRVITAVTYHRSHVPDSAGNQKPAPDVNFHCPGLASGFLSSGTTAPGRLPSVTRRSNVRLLHFA